MPTLNVVSMQGDVIEEIEVSEVLFAAEINEHCVYETVKNHLANKRQGTQSAKTRSEVRGGGRKPWRQKGTGRARQGSIRSPQWKGGGVVFAPKPRDYSYTLNKKIKRKAFRSVLTDKFNEGNILVVDKIDMTEPKTKTIAEMLQAIGVEGKALIVTAENNPNIYRSGRNIKGVSVSFVHMLNTYDMLNHEKIIFLQDAIQKTEEVYA